MKYVLAFGPADLPEILKTEQRGRTHQDIIPGIELKESDFNPALYKELSAIDFSHVIILNFKENTAEGNFQDAVAGIAGQILHLLLNPAYSRINNKITLFLKTDNFTGDKIDILRKSLTDYGLHSVQLVGFQHFGENSLATEYRGIDDLKLPPAGEYVNSEKQHWSLFRTSASGILADFALLSEKIDKYRNSDALILSHTRLNGLHEENKQLRDTIAVLMKNVNDLNNYYRYVRGETHFKHHNREPQDEKPAIVNVQELENNYPDLQPSILSEKARYVAYYDEAYEQKPILFKKLASVIKIVLGRRELRYYLSKKHKQAFIDFLLCLSEDKRVQIWYYYEYEILPGWYKRIGKMIKTSVKAPAGKA